MCVCVFARVCVCVCLCKWKSKCKKIVSKQVRLIVCVEENQLSYGKTSQPCSQNVGLPSSVASGQHGWVQAN